MILSGGGRKASSGDHVENDENENMPSGATASHVNADTHSGDPKKKRKRKNKKKKSDQAGGPLQDTVEEDGQLAKKMKTESTMEEKKKEGEVAGTETILTKELRPTRAQRRRLRKKIIKKLYMEKVKSQNNASNVREEQETQGEDNAKERKLNGADGSLASVNNGKENTDMKTEDVATKKKKKRRRKKKQNPVSDSADVIKEDKNKEKAKEENVQPKKMKKETTEDTPDKKEIEPETTKKKTKKGNFKRMIIDKVNPSLANAENKKRIANCWKSGSEGGLLINKGSIEVIKSPFTCCYIHNLLEDETCLDGVKKELDTIELFTKNNDLYKFRQTGDLKAVTTPFISALRHFLRTFVRQWLIDVTGIPLSDEIDMSSSRYSHTDVLLCHDDELEGRRIAYILYLLPPWGPEDGGSLDLFATDGDGHPSRIVRSITPENNAFAFFEVSPVSFHQVSEVLSCDKTRLSINGWFHGPPVPRPKRRPPPPSPLTHPVHLQETDFYAWINPMFLDTNIQKEIRQTFCSESEINLENFLTDEAYKRLSEALNSEGLAWQLTGPADRQRYEILSPDSMPQDVKECRQFLGCEALFLVLSQLTGLKLHRLAPQDSDDEEECGASSAEPNPQCHMEAQRWGPGCYTLIRDDCVDGRAALDTFLYANVSQHWTQELGGHVTYIAKDEDEELLTVGPQSNCLCLVYRDTQTLKFTKYINSAARDLKANDSHFTNFACTYYE